MQNIVNFSEIQRFIARVWEGQRCMVQPFSFNFEFGDVNVGAETSATLKINSNADFLITDYAISDDTLQGQFGMNNCLLQIVDNGSLEQFWPEPIYVSSVCRVYGQYPRDMAVPRRVGGNSSLTATFNCGSNVIGTLLDLQLTLNGVLVFPYSGR